MAGFLDSKTRLIDTILTQEGRRQMSSGKLQAKFYSFSDMGAFYTQDTSLNGAVDANNRPYLEASNLPQDSITFESDDAGKLVRFPGSSLTVKNGKILVQITESNVSGKVFGPVQSSDFSSQANTLLSSSIESYKKCYIIGSPDIFDENRDSFAISPENIKFTITLTKPISYSSEIYQGNVELTDGLFADSRLSHLPNFQYLPPINKHKPGDSTVNLLGNYPNLNQKPQLSIKDVEQEASWAVQRGFSKTVKFEETSKTNNIFCQMFEIGNGEVVKLDVIDFGLFSSTGNEITLAERKTQQIDSNNPSFTTKHVFFAGKVFTDSNGVHKFITLFTLIFS